MNPRLRFLRDATFLFGVVLIAAIWLPGTFVVTAALFCLMFLVMLTTPPRARSGTRFDQYDEPGSEDR